MDGTVSSLISIPIRIISPDGVQPEEMLLSSGWWRHLAAL